MPIDCFKKYRNGELQDKFEKMIADGMNEYAAARELILAETEAAQSELNAFKKSIGQKQEKYTKPEKTEAIIKRLTPKEEPKAAAKDSGGRIYGGTSVQPKKQSGAIEFKQIENKKAFNFLKQRQFGDEFAKKSVVEFVAKDGSRYYIRKTANQDIFEVFDAEDLDEQIEKGGVILPKAVGMAVFDTSKIFGDNGYFSGFKEAESIKVEPEYRRKGIATAITKFAEKTYNRPYKPTNLLSKEMQGFVVFYKTQQNLIQPKDGDRVTVISKTDKKGIEYFYRDGAWRFLDSRGKEQKATAKEGETVTDEWRLAQGKALSDKSIQTEEGVEDVETYIQKAKDVLYALFPDARLVVYETNQEYVDATGDEFSRGGYIPSKKQVVLNLEKMRTDRVAKTPIHEVVHPIVREAMSTDANALTNLWNDIANLPQDTKGLDLVYQHIASYDPTDQIEEGVTEFITRVVDGSIDVTKMPDSLSSKIIDIINKLFDLLGINIQFGTPTDLKRLSNAVKKAFETGDVSDIEKTLGRKRETEQEISPQMVFGDKGSSMLKDMDDFTKWVKQMVSEYEATTEDIMDAVKRDYPEMEADELSEIEAKVKKIVEGGKEKKEQPKTETKKSGETETRYDNRSIIGRILKSENISQRVKDILEPNLRYKVKSKEEARAIAKDIVSEFGVESSVVMAESGKFHGDVNSAIFAVALDNIYNKSQASTEQSEKLSLDEQWADIAFRYQLSAESGGRFISFIDDFYKKNPAGLVIKTEKEFQKQQETHFKGREKSVKEAFEELINTAEGKEIFDEAVKTEAEKSQKKTVRRVYSKDNEAKVRAFFRRLKINTSNTGSYLIPPQLYNAAVTIIEEAVIGGMSIARAIDKAVDYINQENGGKTWRVNEFKKDIKDGFKKLDAKRILTDEEKEKILNKWRKKLAGLNEAQQSKLLSRAFTQLMEVGALEYDDFKRMYAEEVGLPVMTPELSQKLMKLAEKLNAPDEIKTKIQNNPTREGIQKYTQALKESEQAARELNDLIGKEKWWVDTLATMARLNTLGVVSLVGNVAYNVASMPVRFGVNLTATGIDYLLAGVQRFSDGAFGTSFYNGRAPYNVFKIQGAYLQGFKYGSQKAVQQTINGLTSKDYFQKEIRQNIQPLNALKKGWRMMTRQERVSLNKALNAFMEGTMGWSAEAVARILNLGDKPFRFASEYAKAEQLAQEKGLKGIDKEVFIIAPDAISEEIIRSHGEEMTLQQKNIVTQYLDAGGSALKRFIEEKGTDSRFLLGGIKILGYGTQPFLNTPLNAFVEFMNYAFPPIALAKAARSALKGDNEAAVKHSAQAVIGMAMGYVALELVKNGILVPDTEDDDAAKEREGVMAYAKPGQLNWSGLVRLVSGENPEPQKGDNYVDIKYWGFMGMVLMAKASQYKEEPIKTVQEQNAMEDMIRAFPASIKVGLTEGVFSSTGTLFKALTLGGGYSDQWLLGMASVYQNAIQPQLLVSISRAGNEFYRDTKGMTLSETAVNKIKERTWQADELPKKVNIWGDYIPTVPAGNNAYFWHFFSLNKSTILDNDKFGYQLYDLYTKTKNEKVFPPSLKREISGIKMTPQEYENYKILVGKKRKALAEAYMTKRGKIFFTETNIDRIASELEKEYEVGKAMGQADFLKSHPEFYNKLVNSKKKQ